MIRETTRQDDLNEIEGVCSCKIAMSYNGINPSIKKGKMIAGTYKVSWPSWRLHRQVVPNVCHSRQHRHDPRFFRL